MSDRHGYIREKHLGCGVLGCANIVSKGETNFVKKTIVVKQKDFTESESLNMFLKDDFVSPFLLKYHTFFWSREDHLCLIMELSKCGNLRDAMDNTDDAGIDVKFSMKVFLQLLLGLDYLHARKIIHGDLIPENIFVNDEWDAKMGDYGFGKLVHSSNIERKIHPCIVYSAPEVIHRHNKTADVWSEAADVWSLAVIVFEMMANKVPFGVRALYFGFEAKDMEIMPMETCDDPDVIAVLCGMLKKEAKDRLTIPVIKKMPVILKYAEKCGLTQYFS